MRKYDKQYEVLKWASFFLKAHGCEENAAPILLQHYLGVSRAQFFANMQELVPAMVLQQFEQAVRQHATTGVPVQHLMGYASFYGRDFTVSPDVLIPRPETEELVYHAVNSSVDHPMTIVDVGTGSGIIAITLALELPSATVYATDVSSEALLVAKRNALLHGAEITFMQGNFLEPIIHDGIKADLVISNPPYIAQSEAVSLSRTVKDFDPDLALFAEDNGLAAYREIMHQLPQVLDEQGKVMFEIGHQQGKSVADMVKKVFPHSDVLVLKDMNGKDRIVRAVV